MANAATTLQPPLETKELLAKGESYITHLEVKEGSNKPVYLLISTEHFYKVRIFVLEGEESFFFRFHFVFVPQKEPFFY